MSENTEYKMVLYSMSKAASEEKAWAAMADSGHLGPSPQYLSSSRTQALPPHLCLSCTPLLLL